MLHGVGHARKSSQRPGLSWVIRCHHAHTHAQHVRGAAIREHNGGVFIGRHSGNGLDAWIQQCHAPAPAEHGPRRHACVVGAIPAVNERDSRKHVRRRPMARTGAYRGEAMMRSLAGWPSWPAFSPNVYTALGEKRTVCRLPAQQPTRPRPLSDTSRVMAPVPAAATWAGPRGSTPSCPACTTNPRPQGKRARDEQEASRGAPPQRLFLCQRTSFEPNVNTMPVSVRTTVWFTAAAIAMARWPARA